VRQHVRVHQNLHRTGAEVLELQAPKASRADEGRSAPRRGLSAQAHVSQPF
jgi:hypothetical protein